MHNLNGEWGGQRQDIEENEWPAVLKEIKMKEKKGCSGIEVIIIYKLFKMIKNIF